MSQQLPVAVVLSLDVNGLGVVRSLARRSVPVVGVYHAWEEAGRWSRLCRGVRFRSGIADEEAYVNELLALGASLTPMPVLIATSDQQLEVLTKHRDRLARVFRFNIPDAQLCEQVLSKSGNRDLAVQAGVPIPRTLEPRSADQIRDVAVSWRFPCIIKPTTTFSGILPGAAKNIVAKTPDDLRQTYTRWPALLGNTVIQEIIFGGDGHVFVCAAYCDTQGAIAGMYTGRKIRQYLPDYGVTCYGESLLVPEIRTLTEQLLTRAGYKGLAAAEFSRSRDSGEFYFIELNGRSYYHNALFTACGVNLSYANYADLAGLPFDRNPTEIPGIRWLDFNRDLGSFIRKRRAGEITTSGWLVSLTRARSFGYFDPGDPLPALAAFIDLCATFVARALRRLRRSRVTATSARPA